MAWEEYSEIVWEARDKVREAKTQLELSLTTNVKDNMKGFYRYVANKRKTRDNVSPLLKENGNLATLDMEKVEVLNNVYASVFNSKCSNHATQVMKGK